MARTETVVLTNMCLLTDREGRILVQNRTAKHWSGVALPGGHVEKGEPFTESVIREMREETGLTVLSPKLCGVVQFRHYEGWRYLVFLYQADRFSGTLRSSDEGEVFWVRPEELCRYRTVPELPALLKLCGSGAYSELYFDGPSNDSGSLL